ncbi:MAG: ABC transporter permease [Candidatus Firestonebacteria bacterium]|nr:ABC transporter permease [Candidatus Firestonebacteria bacterium]
MLLLLNLGLRNLLRQKRRNILLGSAMAIGVMLLVMANSFSHGLSDIMLNKVLRWVTGHVTVAFNERGRMMTEVFRDKAVFDFLKRDYSDSIREVEESIGMMARVVGHGNAENMILVGTDMSPAVSQRTQKETDEMWRVVGGRWQDLTNPRYENPVAISADKARSLNVKLFDTLRLRLRNLYGQDQSARVTVVAIITTSNIFMGSVMFGEVAEVKTILGFDEHSTGSINLVLKNPAKDAVQLANAIHDRLQPALAVIAGQAEANREKSPATVLGFNSDASFKAAWAQQISLVAGDFEKARLDKTALVAQPLARALGLSVGSAFTVRYTDKWGRPNALLAGKVGGIFRPEPQWGPGVILLQDDRFYESFYAHLPQAAAAAPGAFIPGKNHPAYALLAPEWVLLPRTSTTDEMTKKMREMGRRKYHATLIDVRTMYETAEQILKLEGVLNLITLSAVLVLFFIILIGVINTLRMTIRERTREIGTVRAIGMQSRDVRNLFIVETVLLAFFASVAGVLLALLVMWGLGSVPMNVEESNAMGMFLINSRLYFIPTWGSVFGNMVLIWVLAGVTAFFPARRAAKLAPGVALRHVE